MARKKQQSTEEGWLVSKWRPMMAVTYMAINIFDFILGPVFFNLLQFYNGEQAITSWQAITLQGGGLIHVAFGAILGVAAWTRGVEKIESIKASRPDYAETEYYGQRNGGVPRTGYWRRNEGYSPQYNESPYSGYEPRYDAPPDEYGPAKDSFPTDDEYGPANDGIK